MSTRELRSISVSALIRMGDVGCTSKVPIRGGITKVVTGANGPCFHESKGDGVGVSFSSGKRDLGSGCVTVLTGM